MNNKLSSLTGRFLLWLLLTTATYRHAKLIADKQQGRDPMELGEQGQQQGEGSPSLAGQGQAGSSDEGLHPGPGLRLGLPDTRNARLKQEPAEFREKTGHSI